MKRGDLEHVLRAAGAITGVSTWVIVGSQAILGAVPNAPRELLVSQEVDLYAPGDESAATWWMARSERSRPFTNHSATTPMASGRTPRSFHRAGANAPSLFRALPPAASSESARNRTTSPSASSLHGEKRTRSLSGCSFSARRVSLDEIRARLDEVDEANAIRISGRLRGLSGSSPA
jgi:hypothetical protein